MTDENQEPNELQEPTPSEPTDPTDPTENQSPVIVPISQKPLKRKYKRFADRYLVNGMNAAEAYTHVFKPKSPESAYSNAYRIIGIEGVKKYIDAEIQRVNEVEYSPESIKQGIQRLSMSAKRDADKLAALTLMSKISGLLSDASQTQVNFFDGDVMALARKRLSERKKDSQKPVVIDADSPQVIERQEVTDSMSYNNNYVPAESESVLSTNEEGSASKADAIDSSADGDGGQDEGTQGSGVEGPPPTG